MIDSLSISDRFTVQIFSWAFIRLPSIDPKPLPNSLPETSN